MATESERHIQIALDNARKREKSLTPWDEVQRDLNAVAQTAADEGLDQYKIQIDNLERELRRERSTRLTNFIEDKFKLINSNDFDSDELLQELDKYENAAPREEFKVEIQKLRVKLNKHSEQLQETEAYRQAKAEINALHEEAREKTREAKMDPTVIANDYYLKARTLAEQYAGQYPGNQSFTLLKDEASFIYEDARRQADLFTTAMQLHKYEELLQELRSIAQEDPNRMIEKRDEKNIRLGVSPVREVIEYVEERATVFANNNFKDKVLEEARQFLEDRNPQAALDKVQEGLRAKFLADEVKFNGGDFVREFVQLELDKFNSAKRKIEQALNEPDIKKAFELLEEAKKEYEWLPQLRNGEARTTLIRQMQQRTVRLIGDAERAVERNDIESAKKYLRDVHELTQYPDLDYLNTELNRVNQLLEHVIEEGEKLPEISGQLNRLIAQEDFAQAEILINEFLHTYKGALNCHAGLNSFFNRIQARQNVQQLAQRAESLRASGDISKIREIMDACEIAMKENATEAKRFKIEGLYRNLEPRYNFLQGELAWNGYNVEQSKDHLLKVVNDANASKEDSQSAKKLLDHIKEIVEQDIIIRGSLDRADAVLGNADENQQLLLKHYQELIDYRDKPSTHREDYERIFYGLSSKLEAITVKQIRQMLKDENTLPDELEQQWQILRDGLQSSFTFELDRPVRLELASRRANIAFARGDWQLAYQEFDTAQGLSPNDNALQAKLLDLRRRYVRELVNRTLDATSPDFEALLEVVQRFEREVPDNVEAKLLLALSLLGIAKHEENPSIARNAIDRAIRTASRAEQTAQSTNVKTFDKEIRSLTTEMQEAYQQVWDLLQIDEKLRLDSTLSTFHTGVEMAKTIVHNLRNLNYRGLSLWWEKLKAKTVNALLERLATIDANNYWARFPFITKIAVIQPENQQADLLNMAENRINELFAMINNAKADKIGANYIQNNSARYALDHQIAQTERISRQINDIQIANKLKLTKFSNEALKQCQTERDELGTKLGELSTANEYFERAINRAHVARRKDSKDSHDTWEGFEETLGEIKKFGYGRHVIIDYLDDYRNELQGTRDRLLADAAAFRTEFEQERLQAALDLLDGIKAEDPTDEYNIQRNISVEDPYKKTPVRGDKNLRLALELKITQINKFCEILSHITHKQAMTRLSDYRLSDIRSYINQNSDELNQWLKLKADTRIITADEVLQQVDNARRASHFGQALSLLQQDLTIQTNADADEIVAQSGGIALRHISEWFRRQMSSLPEPLSYQGALYIQALRQLEEAVRKEIARLNEKQSEVKQWEADFELHLKSFDSSLDALTSKRSPKNQIEQVKAAARAAFAALKEIAPDYSGLMLSADDYRALGKK